jgi:hypothetical protein
LCAHQKIKKYQSLGLDAAAAVVLPALQNGAKRNSFRVSTRR